MYTETYDLTRPGEMPAVISKSKNLWVTLGVVLTIFFNNETLANNLSRSSVQPMMIAALYVIALFFLMLSMRKIKLQSGSLLAMLGIVLTLGLSFLIDNISFQTTNAYSLLLMAALAGFALSQVCSLEHYMRIYCNTLVVIAAASLLFTYVFKGVVESMPSLFPVATNSARINFTNVYVTYVRRSGTEQLRNYGIFREPGVYAIFLIVALGFLMQQKKAHPAQYGILALALLTTFSLPGYLAVFVLLVSKIRTIGNRRLKNTLIAFSILLIFIFALLILYTGGGDNALSGVFEKLNSNSSSFQYRVESLLRNLHVWGKSPVFGNGIISGNELLQNYPMILYPLKTYQNTSSFTAMLVFFGAGFTLIIWALLFRFCRNFKGSLLFFAALAVVLNSQMLIYNTIIYTLVLYGALAVRRPAGAAGQQPAPAALL